MKVKHALHGHGRGRKETVERYIILVLIAGVALAGIGIGATAFGTKGAATAIALVGSFITFISTVVLVFYWAFRGDA